MSHRRTIQRLALSLLTIFSTFTPATSAATPPTLASISHPVLPNFPNPNSTISVDPPRIVIKIDATHDVHFTQYRHFFPERNYFAAIISLQTSLIVQYFERQGEDLDTGGLSLDAYGAEIYLDNLTGRLTYAMAHRMLGELGKFLMGGYRCAARFELWETQGAQAEQLSVGWLEPEDTNKNAV